MSKKIVSALLAVLMILSLAGCSTSNGEIDSLNNLSALNSESAVSSNYNLSYTDEQEMIYAQVSNRNLIDVSALTSCSTDELNQVLNYMEKVDKQLTGQTRVVSYADAPSRFEYDGYLEDDSDIDSQMTNYLLTVMEQTPYYWQRTKTTVRGMDSVSRSIVVDVTYKTIDFPKTVVADSTIVLGQPDYQTLSQSRYTKWLLILRTKENNPNSPELPSYISAFNEYWGDPEAIIAEQRRYEPTTNIYLTGNQQTYTGLIDSAAENSHGTMVVRYVLVPNYVLGINLGMTCEHMYLMSYALDNDCTTELSAFTDEGYQTVTNSVYNLIYAYFTCMDESDFNGLYKLTSDFEGLDKHYQDVFNSTYQKHNGFAVSLFDITGTHISCGITISCKERARGANITFPIYTDRYYAELELVDDTLKVSNLVWLSRKLEGEPAIHEGEIDQTGFSAVIDLSNDDKVSIEKLICDFSALQLANDTTSDAFLDVVDGSVTTNQLASLKTSMTTLSGAQKVVFLQNYQQGTSNYASVKCKELYQDATNAIVEANVTYEFIMKGGRWYIYNYDVNTSIKLDTTNLVTAGSLCLVEPNKVVAYTSQIKGTVSTNLDEVSDISVSYDHAPYTPALKSGVSEQGLVLVKTDTITDEEFEIAATACSLSAKTRADLAEQAAAIDEFCTAHDVEPFGDRLQEAVLSVLCVNYNVATNRYKDNLTQYNATTEVANAYETFWSDAQFTIELISDVEAKRELSKMLEEFSNLGLSLR